MDNVEERNLLQNVYGKQNQHIIYLTNQQKKHKEQH
jgi:hypothetical protein